MKTYLECIPCFMNQALRAGKIAVSDEETIKLILSEVGKMIVDIPMENTPPETGKLIYEKISEITGIKDPYKKIKNDNMNEVISMIPKLREIIDNSSDRLLAAVRLSIAGNVIDLGVNRDFNILQAIEEIMTQKFAINDYEIFRKKLSETDEILFLGDNSGESVFDKILIEEMGKKVVYAVKEQPIINDTTMIEAKYIGLDKIATIISSGSTAPGTIMKLCNEDFKMRFNKSKFIISKGQGNFEGLSNFDAPIFFLLRAKCPVISRDLCVDVDSIILKYQRR